MCSEVSKITWPFSNEFDNDEVEDIAESKIKLNETSFIPTFINETSFISTTPSETSLLLNNVMLMIEMFLYAFKLALLKYEKIKSNGNINFSKFHILQYYNITSFNNNTQKMRPYDLISYFLDGAGPVITDENEDINSLNGENFTIKVSSNITKPYHPNTIISRIYGMERLKYLVNKYGEVLLQVQIKEENIDYEKHNCYSNTIYLSNPINCVIIGWDDNYSKSNFKIKPYIVGAFLMRVFGIKNVNYLWISYDSVWAYCYSFGDIDKSLFVDNSIKTYAYDNPSAEIVEWECFEKSYISEEYGIEIPELEGNTMNVFNTTYINNEYLIAVKYYIQGMVYYQLIFEQNNESTILDEGYHNIRGYYTFILKDPIKLITNKFSVKLAIKGNVNFYYLFTELRDNDDVIEPNQSYINNYDIYVGKYPVFSAMKNKTPDNEKYEIFIDTNSGMRFGPCLIRAITRIDGTINDD